MNAQEVMHTIAALDLDPIKVKLMHEESGEGWTLERATEVEFEYRRFLFLMNKFPNEQTAPLVDVDTFWHYHILDTMKYAADCDAVFGYFLHHFPYIGLRGEDDEAAHVRVGERMKELYEETFGEAYMRAAPTAHSGSTTVAKTAHSGSTTIAKTAHSGSTTVMQTAHSGSTTVAKTAHSGSTTMAKTAYSGSTTSTQAAHSGAIGASLALADAAIVAAQASSFYSQRPRLGQAA